MAEKKVSRVKIKKKRWFPILAPGFLGGKEVGESYLGEAEAALGRTLKVNLRDLTGSMRDQNVYVSLRIKEVAGNNLQTEVVGYAYMGFFIKKLVRKEAGKIEDSFVLGTKDNKKVRLKPLVITVFSVNKSVKTAIRKGLRKMLGEEVGKLGFDNLINDLLRYKLQMEFKKRLNKICPVREMVMRAVELEEGKREKVRGKKLKKEAEEGEKEAGKEEKGEVKVGEKEVSKESSGNSHPPTPSVTEEPTTTPHHPPKEVSEEVPPPLPTTRPEKEAGEEGK